MDRKAGTSRLETPGDGGRIAATFYQAAGAQAQRRKPQPAAEALGGIAGSFKNDPDAPMEIEADTLDVHEATKRAIFKGNVRALQGEMLLRTSELTAFYAGSTGLGLVAADDAGAKAKAQDKGQIVRLEARSDVLLHVEGRPERQLEIGDLRREGQHGAARGRRARHQARQRSEEPAEDQRAGGPPPQDRPDDRRLLDGIGSPRAR